MLRSLGCARDDRARGRARARYKDRPETKKPRIAGRGRKGRKRMEELKQILNGDLSGQDLEVTVTYLQEEQAHA